LLDDRWLDIEGVILVGCKVTVGIILDRYSGPSTPEAMLDVEIKRPKINANMP